MNIKSLISGISAAALVSSLGLAYAQTTTEPATPTSPTMQQTAPGMQSQSQSDMNTPQNNMNNPASGSSFSNETMAEREARADRN